MHSGCRCIYRQHLQTPARSGASSRPARAGGSRQISRRATGPPRQVVAEGTAGAAIAARAAATAAGGPRSAMLWSCSADTEASRSRALQPATSSEQPRRHARPTRSGHPTPHPRSRSPPPRCRHRRCCSLRPLPPAAGNTASARCACAAAAAAAAAVRANRGATRAAHVQSGTWPHTASYGNEGPRDAGRTHAPAIDPSHVTAVMSSSWLGDGVCEEVVNYHVKEVRAQHRAGRRLCV
jgi:hypothetical protein